MPDQGVKLGDIWYAKLTAGASTLARVEVVGRTKATVVLRQMDMGFYQPPSSRYATADIEFVELVTRAAS